MCADETKFEKVLCRGGLRSSPPCLWSDCRKPVLCHAASRRRAGLGLEFDRHDRDAAGAAVHDAARLRRKTTTAADYKGKVVLLYFGYTYCPDVCPTTLFNIAQMLKTMGKRADDVRVLFVTVDPNRDTLPVLKQYTEAFAPQVVGSRGTPDQLAALAKRYRVAYSVELKESRPRL